MFYSSSFFTIIYSWMILQGEKGFIQAASYNQIKKNVINQNNIPVLDIRQQRYIQYNDRFYDDQKTTWKYLYVTLSKVSATFCSNLCMDHDECVSFFHTTNEMFHQNCYLNNHTLRMDQSKAIPGWKYFELENHCTKNRGICENKGICIPNYKTGGSSCECPFVTSHPRCKINKTTTINIVEDRNHITHWNFGDRVCEVMKNMSFLYTCGTNKCHRVSIGIGFKLNIPKEANILSAKFTCWTAKEQRRAPTYKVHMYSVIPRSLSYLDECSYENSGTYDETPRVEWNINDIGSHDIPVDTEITTGNILQGLVQDFVNHNLYTPDMYYQLLFLNLGIEKDDPLTVERIYCHGYDTDLDKRARLTIEWTL